MVDGASSVDGGPTDYFSIFLITYVMAVVAVAFVMVSRRWKGWCGKSNDNTSRNGTHTEPAQQSGCSCGEAMEDSALLIARAATEFVGTFLLCFTVALTAGKTTMAPLAIGTILAVCVYGGGYLSGGHYNPAVTFAALLCGKISIFNSIVNTLSQFGGAFAAGLFAIFLEGSGKIGYPAVGDDFTFSQAVSAEAICTCFLCIVVLGSACSKATAGKDFYGFAIGMTVFACAISSGRISGGAFNPAVGILGATDNVFDDLSVYLVGPYLGALIASVLYRLISPGDVAFDSSKPSNWNNYKLLPTRDEFTLTNKCIAEALGTFFLTYTVTMCDGKSHMAALAIGTSLTTAIYGIGFVSGGHFNPAVSVGVFVHNFFNQIVDSTTQRGPCPKQLVWFIVSQVSGACLAAAFANHISDLGIGMPAAGLYHKHLHYSTIAVLAAEILATGTLVYTVLNTCFSRVSNNNYFGYAIGSVVFVMASAVGPISGGGFNPAVCTACFLANKSFGTVWIYWAAPCLGGALAALVYRSTHLKFENHPDTASASSSADAAPASPTDKTPILPSTTKDATADAGKGKVAMKGAKKKSAPPGGAAATAPLAASADKDEKKKSEDEEKKPFKPVGMLLGAVLGAVGLVLTVVGVLMWVFFTLCSFILPCTGFFAFILGVALTLIKIPLHIAEWVIEKCPC